MISCRFRLYMSPVVATFYLTNFLATDRSKDGFHWSSCSSQEYNDSYEFFQSLKGQEGSKIRVVMYEAHPKKGTFEGHKLYGIQSIQVDTRNLRPVVEKCAKAAHSPD